MTAVHCSYSRKLLCLAAACACAEAALAGPAAPVVNAGSASYNPTTLTVTSTSARTQISWPSFHLAAGETVKFVQPDAQSVVLNQIFDPQSLSRLGGVSSNGSVFFIGDGRVSGAGVNLDLAGMINTSLRLPRMALASGRDASADRPRALTTLAEGSIFVIGEDAQALSMTGADVLLNPGRTVELANAAMPNLRVMLTAPDAEAINLSRLVGAKHETGIFAALFRVPAAARQSTQRDAQAVMTAAADPLAPETAELRRFYRYVSMYAQMRRETGRHEGGMMQLASAPRGGMLLASAKSRSSVLPQEIEIGARPAASAVAAATALPVVTIEPQPVLAAQDEAGHGSLMLLALAPALSAAEIVATPEPQPIPAAVESEPRRGMLQALAARRPALEIAATLEPQPIATSIAGEHEPVRGLLTAIADAAPVLAAATLEPQPIAARAAHESVDLRALAREFADALEPALSRPVQVARLRAEAAPHEVSAPQPAPTVIVVALSQHAAAPAEHTEVKEVRIERRAPRYFTDYRGAMFFM